MKRPLNDFICAGGLLFCLAVTHADGLDRWPLRYSAPGEMYFSSIASGPDRFVAVSENGRIVTSTDAIQWTLVQSGTTARLDSVASGNGVFVVTGYPDTVIRSTDGTNWQSAGWQEPATLPGIVAFANGEFLLLALDEGGARGQCFLSRAPARIGHSTVSGLTRRLRPHCCSAPLTVTATTWLSARGRTCLALA